MPQQLKLPLSYAADLHRKIHKFLDNCLEHSEKTQGLIWTLLVLSCQQHISLDRDCGQLLWFTLYHLTSKKQQVVLWILHEIFRRALLSFSKLRHHLC